MKAIRYICALLALTVAATGSSAKQPLHGRTSPAEWPLLHLDLRNSKWQPLAGPRILVPAWHQLEGKPITNYMAAGPNGRLYALTMDAGPCHLHAFDERGNALWCSDQVRTAFTSLAVMNDGAVFVNDGTELFRFEAEGALTWRVPVAGPAVAVLLTREQYLLVMDYQAVTTAYDPRSGSVVAGPFAVPVGLFPRPNPLPAGLQALKRGLPLIGMDPALVDTFIDAFNGYNSAAGNNVPAVDPKTGRLFIAVPADPDKQTGLLYGIDFTPPEGGNPGAFSIACSAPMGLNSATSPAISEDGKHVYAGDGSGTLFAFNTADCSVAWSVALAGPAPASPTAGPDGRIYMLVSNKAVAIQDRVTSGEVLWQFDIAPVAQAEGYVNGKFLGTLPLSQNYLYAAATYFSAVPASSSTVPAKHVLATIDPQTGQAVGFAELGEESSAIVSLAKDGAIYVGSRPLSKAAALGTPALAPYTPAPHPGVYAFEPASFKDLVADGLTAALDFVLRAEEALAGGDGEEAKRQINYALGQLAVLQESLDKAAERGELSPRAADVVAAHVTNASTLLQNNKLARAKRQINRAIAKLANS